MTSPGRTRDPEQKIRAIGQAAAELITEAGVDALTHRAVAARAGVAVGTTTRYFSTIDHLRRFALELLADEVDQSIAAIADGLAAAPDPVDYLAEAAHEELSDPDAVFTESSLAYAGLFETDLRELSLRWITGLTDALAPYVGRARAEALAMFLDGATLNTALTGTPPTTDRLEAVIRAVLTMPDEKPDNRHDENPTT